MDVMAEALPARPDDGAARRIVRWWPLAALVGLALAAGLIGFRLGAHGTDVAQMTGHAYVGNHVATIRSGDVYYGVRDSVAWFDANGSFHESGWPDCLGRTGNSVNVRFGGQPVTAPGHGVTFYNVAYIDCRGATG